MFSVWLCLISDECGNLSTSISAPISNHIWQWTSWLSVGVFVGSLFFHIEIVSSLGRLSQPQKLTAKILSCYRAFSAAWSKLIYAFTQQILRNNVWLKLDLPIVLCLKAFFRTMFLYIFFIKTRLFFGFYKLTEESL